MAIEQGPITSPTSSPQADHGPLVVDEFGDQRGLGGCVGASVVEAGQRLLQVRVALSCDRVAQRKVAEQPLVAGVPLIGAEDVQDVRASRSVPADVDRVGLRARCVSFVAEVDQVGAEGGRVGAGGRADGDVDDRLREEVGDGRAAMCSKASTWVPRATARRSASRQ
ncbi:hypothetical protein ABID81_001948 [Frigoribacterium sp. PvP054]